ncbi:hypothetical protein SO486_05285 [Pseudomonas salmasensis]|uniref:Uncharacterized protein n=1 Tax=Pseudomonas salmasensis TaxID=2745514 RepID=A0ABU5FGE6_9PSED|nr:hypothetical protein [Pseudomonas salmasensis]MDY4299409.1 hypothetical protein [Pseudomonas salmasensis]
MMTTRKYHPLAQMPDALPVTVTVAINFVQFDVRNPDISLRAPFDRMRIESATFGGKPACKVIAEVSDNHFWQLTLNIDDGAELGGLITEAITVAHNL